MNKWTNLKQVSAVEAGDKVYQRVGVLQACECKHAFRKAHGYVREIVQWANDPEILVFWTDTRKVTGHSLFELFA